MDIQKNVSLLPFNTLRVPVMAQFLVRVIKDDDVLEMVNSPTLVELPKFILGGGSNVLFTQDYPGIILKVESKGKKIIEENDHMVILEVEAGENWHELVTYAVEQGWGGMENLALIPGTVGAAPVQNIAAYGQSLVDVFDCLEAMSLLTGEKRWFWEKECEFGYRESVFKQGLKDEWLVLRVRLRLSKQHRLSTSYFSMHTKYESVEKELQAIAKKPYTIKDVYQAVVNIRTRQLPSPAEYPTAGSFFKNPVVTKEKLKELQEKITELQFYPVDNLSYVQLQDPSFEQENHVKVAAGRILDFLGWKGKQIGHVSTFPKHALVITHDGEASGPEMVEYVKSMQQDVREKLGIELEAEVRVV